MRRGLAELSRGFVIFASSITTVIHGGEVYVHFFDRLALGGKRDT